jgi:hypothetical protein
MRQGTQSNAEVTGKHVPLMYEALGCAKNMMADTTSAAVPTRCNVLFVSQN